MHLGVLGPTSFPRDIDAEVGDQKVKAKIKRLKKYEIQIKKS